MFYLFTFVIILNTFKYKSPILFETHILVDKS